MTTNTIRQTAKIYEFPIRDRANGLDQSNAAKLAREYAAMQSIKIVYDSWYHDAAIEESDRLGKH